MFMMHISDLIQIEDRWMNKNEALAAALMLAAEYGQLDIISLLLKAGADIHAGRDMALRDAAEAGRVEVVQFLLEQGADTHAVDDEALHLAAKNGHLEVAKLLREWPGKEAFEAAEAKKWDWYVIPPDARAIADNLNRNVLADQAEREAAEKQ